jgi:hypothetical protein
VEAGESPVVWAARTADALPVYGSSVAPRSVVVEYRPVATLADPDAPGPLDERAADQACLTERGHWLADGLTAGVLDVPGPGLTAHHEIVR